MSTLKLILTNVSGSDQTFNGVVVPTASAREVTMPENAADPLWISLQALVPSTFTVKPFGADQAALAMLASFGLAEAAALGPQGAHWSKVADSAAGDATAEVPVFEAAGPVVVSAVDYLPAALMAADNTDYVTITVRKRDGLGGAAVTVATYDSRAANQGALAALTKKAFALGALADRTLALGNILTLEIAKAGAGKVVPAGTLHLHLVP